MERPNVDTAMPAINRCAPATAWIDAKGTLQSPEERRLIVLDI
jgi:hypothetical protein